MRILLLLLFILSVSANADCLSGGISFSESSQMGSKLCYGGEWTNTEIVTASKNNGNCVINIKVNKNLTSGASDTEYSKRLRLFQIQVKTEVECLARSSKVQDARRVYLATVGSSDVIAVRHSFFKKDSVKE